ncbi:MAG TPA: SMP-30/gluconolactonase/LRE family protein, partial [Steroidobacteraceae bacterium]|nr:SMP-30/gluconolactonase/LRE family protein [Steroidobacteraceae bacterium]
MRSTVFAAMLTALGATAVLAVTQAQAATKRTEGPGLKSQEDSRWDALVATCQKNHPAKINFAPPAAGRRRAAPRPAAPTYKPPAHVQAIPDVIDANAHWRHVWSESGNNADGIVGLPDGSVLVAQQDNSDVLRIDPQGHAHVAYQDTNTGGAVSINKQGEVFIVERGLHEGIWELAPQHKILALSYEGDPIDCLGNFGLNDLTAASNGGVYFTVGGLYYAAPDGTVTKEGDVSGTNGVILSPDEKTLYVTSAKSFTQPGNLVAFDVQPDGQLTNERVVAQLTGSGDGSTVDSEGRIYVTS